MTMSAVFFISHPEVVIDPAVPVPNWYLSDKGVHRMRAFSRSSIPTGLAAVWASTETKSIEAAGLLAACFGLPVRVHHGLRENDRSATGFLPASEFEQTADAFFALPDESVSGWELAVDAQRRVSDAVDDILHEPARGTVAIVAHGGVGTLLLCQYLGVPISRALDQKGQGNYWCFDAVTREVKSTWVPI